MTSAQAYTSAGGQFPIKIFKNLKLVSSLIKRNRVQPIHVQLNPTNVCNLDCAFCSCSERDSSLRLTTDQITSVFKYFSSIGCLSVTITGGGEPLLWKEGEYDINWIVDEALNFDIAAGLVTNGYLLDRLDPDPLTWIRISASDESGLSLLFDAVDNAVDADVDWSFSYVVTGIPNTDNIIEIIKYANEHKFTHIRVVNDILNPITDLSNIREDVKSVVDDKLVIWQDRQEYTSGTPRCLISLLKPVIGADGMVYPCCGAQYAQATPDRDYSDSMAMGSIEELADIWVGKKHYGGSNCAKCYYSHYNDALADLLDPLNHHLFV